MKDLFILVFAFIVLTLTSNAQAAGSSLKVEGSCTGTLDDGTQVSFTYYSNFNGCKNTAKAAINFNSGIEGLLTGTRSLARGQDVYSFPDHRLTFADSTGNTSGKFRYTNAQGKKKTTTVSCDVRDYEYSDC